MAQATSPTTGTVANKSTGEFTSGDIFDAVASEEAGRSKRSAAVVSGTYLGRVHNQTVNISSLFAVVLYQTAGELDGCAEVKPPLYGSGVLHGNVRGSRVDFTVAGIRFQGDALKVEISGSYVVSRQDGNQLGDFRLTRQPAAEALYCSSDGVLIVPDRVKPTSRSTAVYAFVGGNYATLYKRCAFLPTDNYGRCGFGPETVAELKNGDRVRILSRLVRAENGEDIYKVRTEQGWEGWLDSRSITIEGQ